MNAIQTKRLTECLTLLLGDLTKDEFNWIAKQLEWLSFKSGEYLFKQGDVAEEAFLLISGRISIFKTDEKGSRSQIGEVIRGEPVGELALLTGEKRSADAMASRDLVLAKISRPLYDQLCSSFPRLKTNLLKLTIARFQSSKQRLSSQQPANIVFVPLEKLDISELCQNLYKTIKRLGRSYIATPDKLMQVLKRSGLQSQKTSDSQVIQLLSLIADNAESKSEYLLFQSEPEMSDWTKLCLRHADQIVLVASALSNRIPSSFESEVVDIARQRGLGISLLLIHQPEVRIPKDTAAWLRQRPYINSHYHLKIGEESHVWRVARLLTGNGIGLVCSGGGAKGFGHLGVFQALFEKNILPDVLVGTSVGSMAASALAVSELPFAAKNEMAKGAKFNPSKDWNWFPYLSMVKGQRLRQMIQQTLQQLCGNSDLDICDAWIPLQIICSNYTEAKEVAFKTGPLAKLMAASCSIPGLFPPIIYEGQLFIDGGCLNNFPVDVLYQNRIAYSIGTDFMQADQQLYDMNELPSTLELLVDWFKPKQKKKIKVPGMFSLLTSSYTLYSDGKQIENQSKVNLYLNPKLNRFKLTDWAAFDEIVAEAHTYTKSVLGELKESQLPLHLLPSQIKLNQIN